ncbi:MAG: PspC domain-containing protein [Rhodospirillaceae bacterium]|nr:PspC domain-containing protein [Rhodospirillaceae bacterium]
MTARTIYRNTDKGKIAGVIAGLSDHFGWNVTYARWAWVIASVFWPPVMLAAYILMAWLLDPAPGMRGTKAETAVAAKLSVVTAEPANGSALRTRFSDVRDRFSRLEQKLRSLEKVVTSREFQMDRELRNSGGA